MDHLGGSLSNHNKKMTEKKSTLSKKIENNIGAKDKKKSPIPGSLLAAPVSCLANVLSFCFIFVYRFEICSTFICISYCDQCFIETFFFHAAFLFFFRKTFFICEDFL